jgi:glycosyltransferase involved in cell wall biosynthesis
VKLTILNVAYPLATVGPDAVGGAEQVLSQLDSALTRAGDDSLVIACEGSEVWGTLLAVPQVNGTLDGSAQQFAQEQHRKKIEEALKRTSIDLIHMHGIDFHRYLPPPGPPVLGTLHLPPAWYPPEVFGLRRPNTFLHCVSTSQRQACPPSSLLLPVIENGVPLETFAMPHAKRAFSLGLGRICPEKGFHIALDAATCAGVPLLLGGEVFAYEAHRQYHREEILPRLNGRHRFLGPVRLKRKRRLLGAARCLLAPSLAPETSSLVAMEALAAGTPVIAFPSGALCEIVEDGRTGYLVKTASEMAEAIQAAAGLNHNLCRETARRRFSAHRMVKEYFGVYRALVNHL